MRGKGLSLEKLHPVQLKKMGKRLDMSQGKMLRGLHSDRTDIHAESLKDATETKSKNLPR